MIRPLQMNQRRNMAMWISSKWGRFEWVLEIERTTWGSETSSENTIQIWFPIGSLIVSNLKKPLVDFG